MNNTNGEDSTTLWPDKKLDWEKMFTGRQVNANSHLTPDGACGDAIHHLEFKGGKHSFLRRDLQGSENDPPQFLGMYMFLLLLFALFCMMRVSPYLLRCQSRQNQLQANTLRGVEHNDEEYELARVQTSVRNMIADMTRMMEITRSDVSMTRTDRREYISNALLRKVSCASVTAEVASAWQQ
jgi:hypothetical protein